MTKIYVNLINQDIRRAVQKTLVDGGVPNSAMDYLDVPYWYYSYQCFTWSQVKPNREDYRTEDDMPKLVSLESFIQKVLEDYRHPKISIGNYTVDFSSEGESIGVGCKTISFATIEQIYNHITKLRHDRQN